MSNTTQEFSRLMSMLFRAHPWHSLPAKADGRGIFNAYIEITPSDTVKFELHKESGFLCIDRPQSGASICPMHYGFIPGTYCGDKVAELCAQRTGRKNIKGDKDPLDICILTEKTLPRGDIIVRVKVIGGLRMIDNGEADDKIVAVLVDDLAFGKLTDISRCPKEVLGRLIHYFETYKRKPGALSKGSTVEVEATYGRLEALEVIKRSIADYETAFGDSTKRLERMQQLLAETVFGKNRRGK